jgi:uncharacterized Zn-finger protein
MRSKYIKAECELIGKIFNKVEVGKKRHICNICKKQFQNKDLLLRHKKKDMCEKTMVFNRNHTQAKRNDEIIWGD